MTAEQDPRQPRVTGCVIPTDRETLTPEQALGWMCTDLPKWSSFISCGLHYAQGATLHQFHVLNENTLNLVCACAWSIREQKPIQIEHWARARERGSFDLDHPRYESASCGVERLLTFYEEIRSRAWRLEVKGRLEAILRHSRQLERRLATYIREHSDHHEAFAGDVDWYRPESAPL